jgi:hypothetical protein
MTSFILVLAIETYLYLLLGIEAPILYNKFINRIDLNHGTRDQPFNLHSRDDYLVWLCFKGLVL